MFFEITEQSHDVILDLRYGNTNNFTGKTIYKNQKCFLHNACKLPLEKAISYAKHLGFRLKVYDGFRPQAAQEALWQICPDTNYLMHPEKGSVHTRGIAIDLTLVDQNNAELDMGTPFDDFTKESHHDAILTPQQNQNRYTLLGIMSAAGWDFYMNEWWHYQLFKPRDYELCLDNMGIM